MQAKLAPYAAHSDASRGRATPEDPPAYRTEFQRDRDRIVHSTAFRRLVYKTQVFVNHEGDLYRTRLTHSLEVAQIARTVARAMGLNEDLVEAICLAHDLGHTPFGHAGQDALNACMQDYGGFEHNLQSLRVVDSLEEGYRTPRGLNLCFETREGILKHCSIRNARTLGDVGRRFLDRTQPGLEAQLANVADEIAYNNHDVDDGLRSGLLTLEQLEQVPFFAQQLDWVRKHRDIDTVQRLGRITVRRMIDQLVTDLYRSSAARVVAVAPADIDAVRAHHETLIRCSSTFAAAQRDLKEFLRANLYRHARVSRMTEAAHATITTLFEAFMGDYARLPDEHAALAIAADAESGRAGAARVVADYVAGMTDRFALQTADALQA